MADEPLFTLEFRPAKPAPPPTMIIHRGNRDYAPYVMPEDHAFELYLLLKEHFEGDGGESEVDAG